MWYPQAVVRRYAVDGGSMLGGPPRVGLHYTQTTGVPSYGGQDSSSNSAPHFTVARDGVVYQHHPADRASRALRNEAGGVQTNRQGSFNIQFELVGYSEKPHDMPEVQRVAAREVILWSCNLSGAPRTWRRITRGSHCYGKTSSCRMSFTGWLSFEGIYAHQEVPENSHWDTGALDFEWLLQGAEEELVFLPINKDDGMGSRVSKRSDVAAIQGMINRAFGTTLTTDGQYGAATVTAVAQYLGGDGTTVNGNMFDDLQWALALAAAKTLVVAPPPPTGFVTKEEFSGHVASPAGHSHKHAEGSTGPPLPL